MTVKTFINNNFMLKSKTAASLYHFNAASVPIFDYHCHLSPKEILENRTFSNMTEIWLAGDHYKWRLMRANGVDERCITGDADPYEKFLKWAETVPKCIGNPLYHWTHLELKHYFDIDELLVPESAPEIWKACNNKLKSPEFTTRGIIERFNVKALCTTDDPIDDLKSHIELEKDKNFKVKVLPTFRPDKALQIENTGFADWIASLSKVTEMNISSFEDLILALQKRAEFFKSIGCMISDHSFGYPDFTKGKLHEARSAFLKAMAGEELEQGEIEAYKTQLMLALGRTYHRLGFAMQLHFGVVRNTNTKMLKSTGVDAGFDSIGNGISADSLISLLDWMNKTDELPRTVIYCLNDTDNAKIASIIGCFQSTMFPSKLQLGAAWWFNDHRDGMVNHMQTVANHGLLSGFIGMLTDSRSFLSYTRHDYFRRILCDLIGEWVEHEQVPLELDMLGSMVKDICFNNSVRYFGLKLENEVQENKRCYNETL
ncbi:Glucuronate isomerase [Ruminiclostridium cellulolyticum H10]|uniref:Uronate isomerase n=1 Tax=Ruminiclostridium cellulolyticum (strain ATCC 35319 / DSM 5812 / JCM 6584 / H10) TaxID=394503 RepID=B8I2N4_RUMCH|nr:Glucuronate isomerase [Ruminiclostridium cellulolyticum H10]